MNIRFQLDGYGYQIRDLILLSNENAKHLDLIVCVWISGLSLGDSHYDRLEITI